MRIVFDLDLIAATGLLAVELALSIWMLYFILLMSAGHLI